MEASCLLETLKGALFTLAFYLHKLFALFRFPSAFSAEKTGPSTEDRSLKGLSAEVSRESAEISREYGCLCAEDSGIQFCTEDGCCMSKDYEERSEEGPSAEDGGCTEHGSRYVVTQHGGKGSSPIDRDRIEHGGMHTVAADDGELSSKHGGVVCRNGASAGYIPTVSADEDLSLEHGEAFSEDVSGHGDSSFAEDDGAQDEDPRKQEFLSLYKEQYGYPNTATSIDEIRANEFPQLKGEIYL
eukprot:c3192_g1_i1 orf=38-766(+)